MKIFLRSVEGTGDVQILSETSCADLKQAEEAKQTGDKIHVCFHDENPVKPCRLI